MNREQVRIPPGNIERQGMQATIDQMRERLGMLQDFADKKGMEWAANIYFVSPAEAVEAVENYDADWFKTNPYSDEVNIVIAQKLIACSAHYPYVDTSVWNDIITANESPL